jgi:hypothetical protein
MCSASKSSKLSSNSSYSFFHTTLSYSAVHGSNQLAFASSITVSTFLYAFSLTVVSLSCLGSSAICHCLIFTHSGVQIIVVVGSQLNHSLYCSHGLSGFSKLSLNFK